jgi:hypothetical protein
MCRDTGIKPKRSAFEQGAVGFKILEEFDPEVIQGELGQRECVIEVFEVKNLIFEAKELMVPVSKVVLDKVFQLLWFKKVVLQGGGNVHQGHAGFDTMLQRDVLVQVRRWPEINKLYGSVQTSYPVDTAKALDDSNRVPVDVVVDQEIAVLKVLPLGDTV